MPRVSQQDAPTIRPCSTPPTPCFTRFRRCASWSRRARSSTRACAWATSISARSMGSDFPDKLHFEFKAVDSAKGELVLPDPVESRWLAADRAEELAAARARLLAALDQTRARQGAGAGGDRAGRVRLLARAGGLELGGEPHLQTAVRDGDRRGRAGADHRGQRLPRLLRLGSGGSHAGHHGGARSGRRRLRERPAEPGHARRPRRPLGDGGLQRRALGAAGAATSPRALVARGVPERALDVQWFGERQPRIATADGVREPQNRRVEIVFGEAGPSV